MSLDAAGERIGGRYALGDLLGVGGTGSVFAAADPTGAEVAVKLLHPHLCADDAAREAFLREARLAMRLDHPNIVRVHDAGLHDAGGVTMPWIALELLTGPTLREHVDAVGPLGAADAVAVVDGLLAGLGAAHQAGLVHRDISPQNVILHGARDRAPGAGLSAGMVRILDFGLADVTGRATVGSDVLLAGAEDGGHVVGNAHFMSPEQAQGLPVRSVSDLYQAGAVLVYALTGRPPFPRTTVEQVMRAHVSAPPPVPSAIAPAARPFDRVVTRALSKTPAHRFRTAAEFRAALAEAGAAAVAAASVVETPDAPAEGTGPTSVLRPDGGGDLDYLRPADDDIAEPVRDARARAGGAGVLLGLGAVAILAVAALGATFLAGSPGAEAEGPRPQPTTAPSTPQTPPPGSASPTPSSSPSPTPEPSTSAPPAPAQVEIPTLFGTLADAEAALAQAGLRLGAVNRVEAAEAADRVLGQRPEPGSRAEPGTAVDVTVASGRNTVPDVRGMSVPAAIAVLLSAGFEAVADQQPASAAATVAGSEPAAGAVLRVGVTVSLRVEAQPTPGPTQTPVPQDPGEAAG
ncbi:hypothetical protein GCM10027064_25680 [Microbacterium petrolearium]